MDPRLPSERELNIDGGRAEGGPYDEEGSVGDCPPLSNDNSLARIRLEFVTVVNEDEAIDDAEGSLVIVAEGVGGVSGDRNELLED